MLEVCTTNIVRVFSVTDGRTDRQRFAFINLDYRCKKFPFSLFTSKVQKSIFINNGIMYADLVRERVLHLSIIFILKAMPFFKMIEQPFIAALWPWQLWMSLSQIKLIQPYKRQKWLIFGQLRKFGQFEINILEGH